MRNLLLTFMILCASLPAFAQTTTYGERLSVGALPRVEPASTTSTRVRGLGARSSGQDILSRDANGNIFAGPLVAGDIPAGYARIDTANTWALLQTFSSGQSINDGLVGTPAIRFTSDPDTGLYRITTDSLGLSTGGAVRLTVNSTGTTAAGTLTSSGAFTASTTSTLTGAATFSNTTAHTGLATFSGNVRAGASPFTIRNSGNSATIATFGDAGHVLTGTATVSGAATLQSTLGVTGATTLSSTLAVTGNTTLTGDLAVNGGDITSTVPLILRPTGNLSLDPTGDIIIAADGNDVLPDVGYTKNLGALSNKYLTLHAAELWVETLVAQDTIATIGGRVLVGPTTVLTSDLSAVATSISVKHNQMANGDRVYMEADGKVEFMAIASAPSGVGPYTYTVTRNLDGSGANIWYAGDAMFNTGTTNNGFIDLYSIDGVLSGAGPTIVGNVRTGTTYNNIAPRWAIGNLNGLFGYGADTYGAAFGNPSDVFLAVDATTGIRMMEGGTNQRALFALDGSILLGSATSTNANTYIDNTQLLLRQGTTQRVVVNSSQVQINDPSGVTRLLQNAGGLYGYDGSSVQRFELSTASGLVVGSTAGTSPNIWLNQDGNMYFRAGGTNRISLSASNGALQMFNPDGIRAVYIDNTYGVILGRTDGVSPQLRVTPTSIIFCNYLWSPCSLEFDGTTGNITSTGNIVLSTGGNITSVGNWSLTNTFGLTFEASAGSTGDNTRSVRWSGGGKIYEYATTMTVYSAGNLSMYGGGMNLNMTGGSTDELALINTAGHVTFRGSASGGNAANLGTAAAAWSNLYISNVYVPVSGTYTIGYTGAMYMRNAYNTAACQVNFQTGIAVSHNCTL